jgi:hypothetical protein
VKRLDPMPARSRLVDCFTYRFMATSNHCLQSATKALQALRFYADPADGDEDGEAQVSLDAFIDIIGRTSSSRRKPSATTTAPCANMGRTIERPDVPL